MAAMVLAAVMMLGCAGCGAKSLSVTEDASFAEKAPQAANTAAFGGGAGILEEAAAKIPEKESGAAGTETQDTKQQNHQTDRKLIKTVDMDVETKEFDKVLGSVEREAAVLGGYIENVETYNGSAYSGHKTTRYASLTIRIPEERLEEFLTAVSDTGHVTRRSENVEDVTLAYVDLESHKEASLTIRIPEERLEEFLTAVSDTGHVTRRSENVEDVTLAYVDLESHKEALETEQKRLLSLLEQAESVEDIITIESRLSEVRYQLESMESQIRTFDNRIDYSTVYLYIDEVEVFSPAQEESAWSRITDGFMNSIKNIADGCREFGILFLIKLPYIVCAAAIAVVIVLLVKKTGKRRKQKSAKNLLADKTETVKTEKK